jgi:hypothetical protein
MEELFGKKTGSCKGKGGSMRIADVEVGLLGAMEACEVAPIIEERDRGGAGRNKLRYV